MDDNALSYCADLIADADALIIGAGAGMGKDSGLPDFRGQEGLWQAYPALRHEGMRFEDIANPAAFARDPTLAWGFYGHRLKTYRATQPHAGFAALERIGRRLARGAFVFTSNVDGQFQQAGFAAEGICEAHGSILHLQCSGPCGNAIWPATFEPALDESRCRLASPLPRCPACAAVARPNILMFDDPYWLAWRTEMQWTRMQEWLAGVRNPVAVEIGAGGAIPTVRHFCETHGRALIRINPQDAKVHGRRTIGLAAPAREVLLALEDLLAERGFFSDAVR